MVDSSSHHRAIADQARTIRIPVHMVETINKLIRIQRQLLQDLEENLRQKKSVRKWIFQQKSPRNLENRARTCFP